MNSPLLKFVNLSITSIVVGGGLGVVAAWCMTARLERQYQMAVVEGASALGAVVGLLLGWIAYYAIFKQELSYETFCVLITATGLATALSAYVLHRLTDTGGWLAILISVAVFIVASFKLRHA